MGAIQAVQPTADATEQYALGMQEITHAMPLPTPVQRQEIGACLHEMSFPNGLPASLKFQKIREITALIFVTHTAVTVHRGATTITMHVVGRAMVAAIRTMCGLPHPMVLAIIFEILMRVYLRRITAHLVTPLPIAVFWMEALQNSPPSQAGAGVPHLTLKTTKSPTA